MSSVLYLGLNASLGAPRFQLGRSLKHGCHLFRTNKSRSAVDRDYRALHCTALHCTHVGQSHLSHSKVEPRPHVRVPALIRGQTNTLSVRHRQASSSIVAALLYSPPSKPAPAWPWNPPAFHASCSCQSSWSRARQPRRMAWCLPQADSSASQTTCNSPINNALILLTLTTVILDG